MPKEKLLRLKILKDKDWHLNDVIISHPFAVDNYENIIKKLKQE